MKTGPALSIVAATAGLLCGPMAQPWVANRLPDLGWSALLIVFVACALAPPVVLMLLAAGEHYQAMVRSWTAFFFCALFIVAAGASAFVVSAYTKAIDPSSLVLFACGLGVLASLYFVKLALLKTRSKTGA